MFMGPRNWCQGMNSASLCSLAGRYENPIPPRCLAPIDFLKIPARMNNLRQTVRIAPYPVCLFRGRGRGLGLGKGFVDTVLGRTCLLSVFHYHKVKIVGCSILCWIFLIFYTCFFSKKLISQIQKWVWVCRKAQKMQLNPSPVPFLKRRLQNFVVRGASKIKLKKVNKKRTVTVRRVIIFLNISRHPLLIWLHCCLHQYKTLKAVVTSAKNWNKVFWGF